MLQKGLKRYLLGHQADSIDISQWGTKGSQVKIPKEFRYFSIFIGRFYWPGHFRPARSIGLGFRRSKPIDGGLLAGFELPSDVLGQDIGFQVHCVTGLKIPERGDLEGMRDQCDGEVVIVGFDERQTDSIDGDGAFRCHLAKQRDRRGEFIESPLSLVADVP